MDFHNTPLYHLVVAVMSFLLISALYFTGINLNRAVAGVAFFLLFLTLIIGPVMRLWKPNREVLPWDLPWSWRGELGIWFTILSMAHIVIVFKKIDWDIAGYVAEIRLSGLVALIAAFWALVLTVTSFRKVIKFLGVSAWKWLHTFTYVVFYLVSAHIINHAFLRPGRPADWLHWSYLVMMLVVTVLQAAAFVKTVAGNRKNLITQKN